MPVVRASDLAAHGLDPLERVAPSPARSRPRRAGLRGLKGGGDGERTRFIEALELFGLGYSWGGGTLTYQGQQYSFTVNGLSIGDVGITDIQAAGTVSHLNQVQDFSGNYTALQAGLTVAGGGDVMTMQNQNGVVLTITSTTQGLDVDIGAGGVSIALK